MSPRDELVQNIFVSDTTALSLKHSPGVYVDVTRVNERSYKRRKLLDTNPLNTCPNSREDYRRKNKEMNRTTDNPVMG